MIDLPGATPRCGDHPRVDCVDECRLSRHQQQPRARICFHHIRRRAPGVPRSLDALHRDERWNPHLDRRTRCDLSQGAGRGSHGIGQFSSGRLGGCRIGQPRFDERHRGTHGGRVNRLTRRHTQSWHAHRCTDGRVVVGAALRPGPLALESSDSAEWVCARRRREGPKAEFPARRFWGEMSGHVSLPLLIYSAPRGLRQGPVGGANSLSTANIRPFRAAAACRRDAEPSEEMSA